MASLASVSSSTSPTQKASSPSEPKKNYLDRCVEVLSEKNEKKYVRHSNLWNIAAKVVLVSFVILAATAFILTGLCAPMYAPIVGLGLLCSMQGAYQLYKKFSSNAEQSKALAEQARLVREEHAKLPSTHGELIAEFAKIGITPEKIENETIRSDLTRLKPALAFYHYWKGQAAELSKLSKTKEEAAVKKIREEEPSESAHSFIAEENARLIQELRSESMALERNSLIAKTNAAFILGVIKHPHFAGTFMDFAKFNLQTLAERAIGRKFQDPEAETFISFLTKRVEPITLDQLQDSTDANLERIADRLMAEGLKG